MPAKVFIETPRLILRQWKETDHEPYIQLNLDKEVAEFFPSALTKDETMAQIERMTNHFNQYGYGRFAIERKDDKRFIGFVGFGHAQVGSDSDPVIEIGWRLSKADWNHGFATEAAKACLEFGFNTLALDEIYSFTSVHNLRSEQVMIKLGMIKYGFFEHPLIENGHFLKPHVLYKISRPAV